MVAVETNELVHLGAFPTHRMMMTACMGFGGNGLKTNRQSARFGDCVVSVSKIISKKIPVRLLFRPKKCNKKFKKIKKKNLPARLLVRPWPDQRDRLLRPCK